MSKIVDQWGRPIDPGLLRTPQNSRVASLQNEYLASALDGLTPSRLASTLRAADNGDLIAQHRLFADMEERDAHLAAEMAKRKLALLGLDWGIEPPRNATAAEKAHAEWLTEVLTDAVDPIEDLILALMDGVGHGFSAVELEWRDEGGERLPSFHPRPQEWFQLDSLRRDLRLRDMSVDGAPLVSFGWAFHTHGKAKTGYLGRMGLYRVLCWPWLYKAYALGDFAELLETFGLPIIVGKYGAGASDDEKASLLRAVTALGHDARAIMPAEMALEIEKVVAGGDKSPHLAMVDWADRAQSKGVLGQTMSAEARGSGLGSGNADLHKEVRHDILAADARQIAGTITRDLLYPLVALNRGNIDGLRRSPRLVFDTGEAEDIERYSKALPALAGAGMQIPVRWSHDKLRIPEPVNGEAVLKGAAPDEAPAAAGKPPAPGKPATPPAALAALAALRSELEAAERDAFDELAEQMAGEWEASLAPLTSPIDRLLQECGSYDEFRRRLPEAIAQMDAAAAADVLARGLFAAHVGGRSIPTLPGKA